MNATTSRLGGSFVARAARVLFTVALAHVFVLLLAFNRAEAFPSRLVHDRSWAVSAPWVTFTVNAAPLPTATVRIDAINTSALCTDPVGRDVCSGAGTGAFDVIVHAFSRTSGKPVSFPLRCVPPLRRCSATVDLESGEYALFTHGGPLARGVLGVTVSATLLATGRVLASRATTVSDNIVLDVNSAPVSGFDVHSVLVPDGPEQVETDTGLPVTGTSAGNIDNDWLGVDATEAWLLDEQFRVLDADLAMRGVGPAAQLLGAQTRNGTPVRYVLVRPYAMPPFAVGPAGVGAPLARDNSKYPFAPGAGRMRVILDVRGDTDGDGLGDRLEAELGLCDGVNATAIGPDDRRVACMLASEVQAAIGRWGRRRIQLLSMSDPRGV